MKKKVKKSCGSEKGIRRTPGRFSRRRSPLPLESWHASPNVNIERLLRRFGSVNHRPPLKLLKTQGDSGACSNLQWVRLVYVFEVPHRKFFESCGICASSSVFGDTEQDIIYLVNVGSQVGTCQGLCSAAIVASTKILNAQVSGSYSLLYFYRVLAHATLRWAILVTSCMLLFCDYWLDVFLY